MIKKIIGFGIIPTIVVSLVISYINCVGLLFINHHTPLQYCIWEIQSHEGYDTDFSFIYQELEPKYEIKKEAHRGCEIYCYYITVFTEDRKGEWFCFIECQIPWYIRSLGGEPRYGYKPSEVKLIDCDIAVETFYGYYGEDYE